MTRIVRRAVVAVALLAGTAACSARSAAGGSESDSTTTARAPRRSPDLLTDDEIATISASNALHAIERLRPTFLRAEGFGLAPVAVYVNGQRFGELQALRSMPAREIRTVRRLSAAEAQLRYGVGNSGGVLDIATKTGGRP